MKYKAKYSKKLSAIISIDIDLLTEDTDTWCKENLKGKWTRGTVQVSLSHLALSIEYEFARKEDHAAFVLSWC